ncbi:MAG: D-tyrosyl-tRNA(Tyr) deacylase [Burkholderiales bacterium]|nr:D-tyrosyl-tRNA(Tyr) deacylase [Burkholderiales bacterium]
MIALLQRVISAHVVIDGANIAAIDNGLLVFIAVEGNDTEAQAQRLLERILTYRVFSDGDGKMNLSVRDVEGGLLLVPQFTLAADTGRGTRPSFSATALPDQAQRLFDTIETLAREMHDEVAAGHFGADMKVHLINDGPVTFCLKCNAGRTAAPRQSL